MASKNEKVPSDSSSKKLKRITVELKKEIVARHENGVRVTDLAKEYGVAKSTISTIIKNKEAIKAADVAKGVTVITKQRSQVLEQVEKLLLKWINEKQTAGDGVGEAEICEKARTLHSDLLKQSPGANNEAEDFKASRGWFEKFRGRAGIFSVTRHGETPCPNISAPKDFVEELTNLIESEGYVPHQVFNCDEIGKKLPKRTYITQEKALPGHKPMKDMLSKTVSMNKNRDLEVDDAGVKESVDGNNEELVIKELELQVRAIQDLSSREGEVTIPSDVVKDVSVFVPKSSTERVRIHREKKRSEEMANKPPKKPPKTGLQRAREYRARRKAALNADVTALAPAQDLTWPMVENDGPSTNAEESRSDEDCSTGEFVRTKWRSLRDYYRHEQRKVQSTKYGSVHKSSWKHYGHMQFLRGTVQRHRWPVQLPSSQGEYVDQLSSADASSQGDVDQPPLANVSFPEDYEPVEPVVKLEYDEDDTEKAMVRIGTPISLATNQQLQIEAGDNQTLDDDSFQKAPSEQHFSLVQFPPTTPQNSLRVRETANKRPASETDPLDFERRKFIVLEKLVLENEDDDLQFFKSLIPDVKNLPRAKKAHLRLRIQQLIVDEIYGNETITNGSEECKMNDT